MSRLFKALILLMSVLIRTLLRNKTFSTIAAIVMGLILLLIILPGFEQTVPEATMTYDINQEILSEIGPVEGLSEMRFRGFPSISPDGRYIAFNDILIENRQVKDITICLYDRKADKLIDLPGLKIKGWDISPSVSKDGRYIAFQSNRSGKHFWNIYLYDTKSQKMVDLPNMNSILPDVNPSISADGNQITFASLRNRKMEVYTYDRNTKKVTPLPNL